MYAGAVSAAWDVSTTRSIAVFTKPIVLTDASAGLRASPFVALVDIAIGIAVFAVPVRFTLITVRSVVPVRFADAHA